MPQPAAKPIVTFSLNPTIDVASEADIVRPTHKIRTTNETYEPGGGGVNVARVIVEMGGQALLVATGGGAAGTLLTERLDAVPIPHRLVQIAGNTRIAITVFERKTGHEFRFTPNGPTLSAAEVAACLDTVAALDFDTFIASGSVPLGAPRDVMAQVRDIVVKKGARFVLDSSGAGLSVPLEAGPVFMVKPSFGEFEALIGRRLDDQAAAEAAADLVRSGRAEIVAVTLGARGVLVAARDKLFRMKAPKVESHSAVGAGDAFVAATTLALARGEALEDAVRLGCAAGAAATLTPAHKVCAREDVIRLNEHMKGDRTFAPHYL
jgi:6-phosphofructokinase 2